METLSTFNFRKFLKTLSHFVSCQRHCAVERSFRMLSWSIYLTFHSLFHVILTTEKHNDLLSCQDTVFPIGWTAAYGQIALVFFPFLWWYLSLLWCFPEDDNINPRYEIYQRDYVWNIFLYFWELFFLMFPHILISFIVYTRCLPTMAILCYLVSIILARNVYIDEYSLQKFCTICRELCTLQPYAYNFLRNNT